MSCNRPCWYKQRRATCFQRYQELIELKSNVSFHNYHHLLSPPPPPPPTTTTQTRQQAIRLVDAACVGQCACADPWVYVWKRIKSRRTTLRKVRTRCVQGGGWCCLISSGRNSYVVVHVSLAPVTPLPTSSARSGFSPRIVCAAAGRRPRTASLTNASLTGMHI